MNRVVDLDPAIAMAKLHRESFRLRHTLADNPLFDLPHLIELARSLPRGLVEFNAGDLAPGQTAETTPKLEMEPAEIVRNIEKHNAWMVLKRVDSVPEYKAVLTRFVEDLFAAAGKPEQRYSDLEGFVFVASANSTTPFHADAEENVLVHIKGDKFFHVWDNTDRRFISEEALEISPATYRNQDYDPGFEEHAIVYQLAPGDGLHVPYMSPHWVHTGNEYAISMAMTWKTPEVVRMNKIRLMNGTLRRFGMPQKAPGVSAVKDAGKVFAHDLARLVLDPLRKTESLRRMLRRMIYGKKANYYYE